MNSLEQLRADLTVSLSSAALTPTQLNIIVDAISHYTHGILEIAAKEAAKTVERYFDFKPKK